MPNVSYFLVISTLFYFVIPLSSSFVIPRASQFVIPSAARNLLISLFCHAERSEASPPLKDGDPSSLRSSGRRKKARRSEPFICHSEGFSPRNLLSLKVGDPSRRVYTERSECVQGDKKVLLRETKKKCHSEGVKRPKNLPFSFFYFSIKFY